MLEPQSTVLFVLLIAIFGVLMWRTLAARRAAFRVLAACLAFVPAMQGRSGQQRGPGAGDGHVLGGQPRRQVPGGAADPEHFQPGWEPGIAGLPAQRRPRLGQQRWP